MSGDGLQVIAAGENRLDGAIERRSVRERTSAGGFEPFRAISAVGYQSRDLHRPQTLAFLGFTHICSITHGDGWSHLQRVTMAKRMHVKLAEIKQQDPSSAND
jgi:hypothetical protein